MSWWNPLSWVRKPPGIQVGPGGEPEAVYTPTVPTKEKVRSGPAGVIFPQFPPYYDLTVNLEETQVHRQAYRAMLADPSIKAAFLGKVLGVIANKLVINPADKKSERARLKAEFVDDVLRKCVSGGFVEMAWNILAHGLIDGLSVCEKVKAVKDRGRWRGKVVLTGVKPKNLGQDLVPHTDDKLNIVGFMGLRYNGGEEFDPKDFVVWRHLPLFDSPLGMSDFRAAVRAFQVTVVAWELRSVALEKRALPLLHGTVRNPAMRPSLEAALGLAKSSNWISSTEDVKIAAIEIAGMAMDAFRNAIQDLREEAFLCIQGALLQALTSGDGAQRGNSQVHKDTSDLLKWYLSEALAGLLNDRENGVIPDLCDTNFADGGGDDYPVASFGGVDDAELAESLQIDTGLHALGLDLSKEELYERYGRKVPESDEDRLAGQAAPGGNGGLDGLFGGGKPPGGDGATVPGGNGLPKGPGSPSGASPPGKPGVPSKPGTPGEPSEPGIPGVPGVEKHAETLRAAHAFAERFNRAPPGRADLEAADAALRGTGYVLWRERGKWRAGWHAGRAFRRFSEAHGGEFKKGGGRVAAAARELAAKHPHPGEPPHSPPGAGRPDLRAANPELQAAYDKGRAYALAHGRHAASAAAHRLLSSPAPRPAVTAKRAIARAAEAAEDLDLLTSGAHLVGLEASHSQGAEVLKAAREEAGRRHAAAVRVARERVAALPEGARAKAGAALDRTAGMAKHAEGKWVTIGAHAPEGEEEKKGGTPVFIQGGKITKGPAHMVGKAPHEVGKVTAEHGANHPGTGTPEGPKPKPPSPPPGEPAPAGAKPPEESAPTPLDKPHTSRTMAGSGEGKAEGKGAEGKAMKTHEAFAKEVSDLLTAHDPDYTGKVVTHKKDGLTRIHLKMNKGGKRGWEDAGSATVNPDGTLAMDKDFAFSLRYDKPLLAKLQALEPASPYTPAPQPTGQRFPVGRQEPPDDPLERMEWERQREQGRSGELPGA